MIYAILLAAGCGERSGSPNKLKELVGGRELYEYALETLGRHPKIKEVVLVTGEDFEREGVTKVSGGKTRQSSARRGVEAIGKIAPTDFLLFHNAANPFVTAEEISTVIEAAKETGAAFVAHPAMDTVKCVKDQAVTTLDRNTLYHAQTPQVIRTDLYLRAIERGLTGTDEMSLVEGLGITPRMVPASPNNFKITTPRDLAFARFLVEGSRGEVRTGIGMDSHRFDRTQRGLRLGGFTLLDEPKMIANSDGDVILHALCNGILQVLGEGSLGTVADPLYERGIMDSTEYMRVVLEKLEVAKYTLLHVGIQLEGARPQIDPLASEIVATLSKLLKISPDKIGLTATTGEDLTPFGRGEGLQCWATVTVQKIKS